MNCLVITLTYLSPSDMCSRLGNVKGEINKDRVYLIEKAPTKKMLLKMWLKIEHLRLKRMKR